MAFADETTATLRTVRANLLSGLDRIADHIVAGTLHDVSPKGSCPAHGGLVTLMLLGAVDAELARREQAA